MNLYPRTIALRNAAAVKRSHTERIVGRCETVAEHSYGVAMLVLTLEPDARAELLKAALYHDLPEKVTGDIPAPAKWDNEQLAKCLDGIESSFKERYAVEYHLDRYERLVLKWADALDLAFYALEQRAQGNQYAEKVFRKITHFITKLAPHPKGVELLEHLQEDFHYVSKR